jgi:hypothetical protein
MNDSSFYLVTKPDKSTTGLEFRWTVSRGRDTYGYNICTLYANGQKVARCDGGGYDMQGTCLAMWFMAEAQERVERLSSNYGSEDSHKGFYGLRHYNTRTKKYQHRNTSPHCETWLDGACGFSSIARIMERLKYRIQYVRGKD